MAGRGRGRGRGQGSQLSFDYSQLGFSGGEALPAPVLQPPPTFPTLEHKPIPLKSGPEMEYMVALKGHFIEYLHTIRPDNDFSTGIERFSDKYQLLSFNVTEKWDSCIQWDIMPTELYPKEKLSLKRKHQKNIASVAKIANVDVSNRLDELAKLEDRDGEEKDDSKESEEKEQDDDDDKENLEEEDEDEEMDDGTDYVNNYFDNGENYFEDEDDNLDDGPIY